MSKGAFIQNHCIQYIMIMLEVLHSLPSTVFSPPLLLWRNGKQLKPCNKSNHSRDIALLKCTPTIIATGTCHQRANMGLIKSHCWEICIYYRKENRLIVSGLHSINIQFGCKFKQPNKIHEERCMDWNGGTAHLNISASALVTICRCFLLVANYHSRKEASFKHSPHK